MRGLAGLVLLFSLATGSKPLCHVAIPVGESIGALAAAKSCLQNTLSLERVKIHLLTPEASRSVLQEQAECSFSKEELDHVDIVSIPQGRLVGLPGYPEFTGARLDFVKFHYADVFPELNKVLHLDDDTIVLGDVCEIHDTYLKKKDVLVAAVPRDGFPVSKYLNFSNPYTGKQCNEDDISFNTGMFLMQLDSWREQGVTATLLRFIRYNGPLPVDEQMFELKHANPLQLMFCHRFEFIEYPWHRQGLGWNEGFDAFATSKLLHWSGHRKAWLQNGLHKWNFRRYSKAKCFYRKQDSLDPKVSWYVGPANDAVGKRDEFMRFALTLSSVEDIPSLMATLHSINKHMSEHVDSVHINLALPICMEDAVLEFCHEQFPFLAFNVLDFDTLEVEAALPFLAKESFFDYAPFQLAHLIPESAGRLLYLGKNVVLLRDAAEIFYQNARRRPALASADCSETFGDYIRFPNRQFDTVANPEMCSIRWDVMLIRPRQWRTDGIWRDILHWMALNRDLIEGKRTPIFLKPGPSAPAMLALANQFTKFAPQWAAAEASEDTVLLTQVDWRDFLPQEMAAAAEKVKGKTWC